MSFSIQERERLDSAFTSVVIPQNTSISLNDISNQQGEESILEVQQREVLFFDEHLKVFVVLHIPQCPEDELRSYLSRLEIRLEVLATSDFAGEATHVAHKTSNHEILYSAAVKHDQDPVVLISSSENDDTITLHLFWEAIVKLNRPKGRLPEASVSIIANAVIGVQDSLAADDEYLEPFQVQEANLLTALKGATGFEAETPFFPSSRLHSVAPYTPKADFSIEIRSTPSKPTRIHPAVISRLRYSKVSGYDPSLSLIASMDIEAIPFVTIKGCIDKADLRLTNGKVISYMTSLMPMHFQSSDCLTMLYRLEARSEPGGATVPGIQGTFDILSVSMEITIIVSGDCKPVVYMDWTTNVDFAQMFGNRPGVRTSSLQAPGQPSSLTPVPRSAISPSQHLQPRGADSAAATTISFSAPEASVKVGVPFTWQVLIVNNTAKPVKLAIIPLPRVQRPASQAQQFAKRHAPKSSRVSISQSERRISLQAPKKEESEIAQAFVDDNVVYALQHSGAVPPETDLLSLTPELRVGPLGPGQCHEGTVRMVAFKPGAFLLDAIRVIDLVKEAEEGLGSPGVVTDLRNLPDVIVEYPDQQQ